MAFGKHPAARCGPLVRQPDTLSASLDSSPDPSRSGRPTQAGSATPTGVQRGAGMPSLSLASPPVSLRAPPGHQPRSGPLPRPPQAPAPPPLPGAARRGRLCSWPRGRPAPAAAR